MREALVGAGLTEVMTYSFAEPDPDGTVLPALDGAEPMQLLNPLGQDASFMRRHPLEGILGAVALNLRRQQPNLAPVRDRAHVWADTRGRAAKRAGQLSRWRARGTVQDGGSGPERVDVYDAKGYAEHVLETLGFSAPMACGRCRCPAWSLTPPVPWWLGATVRDLRRGGSAPFATRLGIDSPVFAVMIPLDVRHEPAPAPVVRYEPLPRYPSVARDVAFLIGPTRRPTAAGHRGGDGAEAGPLLREMTLFDVFRFPDGRRSLAWRLVFQASDRTLTDDEVNAIHARVVRRVCDEFHISLRGV